MTTATLQTTAMTTITPLIPTPTIPWALPR